MMKIRRLIVMFLLVIFTVQSVQSYAQAVAVSRVQNALSGIIQSKMLKRGFASNDPRWGATLSSIGTSVAGAAAGAAIVTAAGISAPAWVTVGAAVGIGALITWGLDSLYKWTVNPDGTVTTGVPGLTIPSGPQRGVWSYGGTVWMDSLAGACAYIGMSAGMSASYENGCFVTDAAGQRTGPYTASFQQAGCPGKSLTPSGGVCPSYTFPMTGGVTNSSLPAAVASIPPAEAAKPANPQVLADLANQLWQRAASAPGYAGLPYDVNAPIQQSEAAAWQQANPTAWPTVGNMAAPQVAPAGAPASAPWSLPNTATPVATADPNASSSPATNPAAANPLENLGADPGIGAPQLEAIPTAQMIMAPLISLFPTVRNFVVPNHSAICPKPSAVVFSKTVVLDAHCGLLDDAKPSLFAVMAFVWSAMALFIVLRA